MRDAGAVDQFAQQRLAFRPVADPACRIDVARAACIDQMAAPLARQPLRALEADPWIVAARHHDRRKGQKSRRRRRETGKLGRAVLPVDVGRRDQQRARHRPAIGLRRQRRPPRHGHAAQRMRDKHHRRPGRPDRLVELGHPHVPVRRVPHAQIGAHRVLALFLPQALPVGRPRIAEARHGEDGITLDMRHRLPPDRLGGSAAL